MKASSYIGANSGLCARRRGSRPRRTRSLRPRAKMHRYRSKENFTFSAVGVTAGGSCFTVSRSSLVTRPSATPSKDTTGHRRLKRVDGVGLADPFIPCHRFFVRRTRHGASPLENESGFGSASPVVAHL